VPASVNSSDPNVQTSTPSANIFSGIVDPYDYETRGRRDPFGQPVPDKPLVKGPVHGPLLPLQKFEIGQLRLMAILWDVSRPQAMLKDPDGNVFIVGPNSKVGPYNGYVAAIREGEIVVVETKEQDGRLVSTAQVVKIAK
jgi:type IV pilus assembly protein PilP